MSSECEWCLYEEIPEHRASSKFCSIECEVSEGLDPSIWASGDPDDLHAKTIERKYKEREE